MTSPPSPALRVATYNVLAQVYAKSSWFPWTERRLMKSKTRRDAIRTYIEKLNVDVLALQEVDGYEDDEENAKSGGGWKTWLASRGYESTYVRRTNVSNAKKDGSCVAWRRDVLEEIERREIAYNDIANEMYPSTSETADGDDDAATVEARSRYLRDCVGNLTLLRRRAFYDVFKWLNYVRRTVRTMREADAGVSASALAEACRSGTASRAWDDDSYMTPEDADDAALFGFEAYVDGRDDDGDDDGFGDDGDVDGLTTDLERRLTMENEELRLRILEVMSNAGLVNEASVEAAFSPVVAEGTASSDAGNETSGAVAPSSSSATRATSDGAGASRRRVPETPEERLAREVDDGYFDSYSYFDIHRDMIGDKARTDAYRDALEMNPSLIKGKKVLDVGCGTGILSMFAARGGASAVVGVDGAEHIAKVARENIKSNGFDEQGTNQIQIVHGKLEDIAGEIPNAPFDVLVSEWMGYGLLFESMLDTVLVARDRFLKPGGAVLPDIATIHIAGFDRAATDFPFWDDVYGFKMPEISKQLRAGALKTAVVTHVDGARVTTTAARVCELDLATCSIADTEFTAEFALEAVAARRGEETNGIVLWFDTEFSKRFCVDRPVMLSTNPDALKTHWVQTMLHFHEPIVLGDSVEDASARVGSAANQGSKIVGRISMVKSKRLRAYDISLEYRAVSANGESGPLRVALYAL